jgi:hypothetical protein
MQMTIIFTNFKIIISQKTVGFDKIPKTYTDKHNTLMLYNNVLYDAVNRNQHRAPILRRFKNINTFCNIKFLR